MRRLMRLCLYVVLTATLLAPVRARAQTAQTVLPNEYAHQECGFAYRYPEGWQAGIIDDRYFMTVGPDEQVVGLFGGFRNLAASPLSPQSAASAAAGAFCLDCMRDPPDKLVWVDRFVEGSTTASEIIYRETKRSFLSFLQGRSFGETPGYTSIFYLFEDGTARGIAPAQWTTGQVFFWVRDDLFRQYEPWIHAIVRSLRFTATQRACWG
jgi:hypothetical protein